MNIGECKQTSTGCSCLQTTSYSHIRWCPIQYTWCPLQYIHCVQIFCAMAQCTRNAKMDTYLLKNMSNFVHMRWVCIILCKIWHVFAHVHSVCIILLSGHSAPAAHWPALAEGWVGGLSGQSLRQIIFTPTLRLSHPAQPITASGQDPSIGIAAVASCGFSSRMSVSPMISKEIMKWQMLMTQTQMTMTTMIMGKVFSTRVSRCFHAHC